ncbi:hypothetical protein A9Q84_11445 [Halobacteriovorax marinus]|uniref:NnrS family protein n=1 Tax=Halobacteriovorax marinus TaxID=97084 RepID=A0A1Y5F7T1_9BACT|nr:hypothetical protein A9Q84_11445 [Halobacteriovorax marinus]
MAFLSAPFRTFFFITALTAILIPMYFVCIMINDYPYPGELLTSFAWHGHEMFFGYTSALLTGFLLTASAHWTGKKVIARSGILFFLLTWIVARVIMFIQPDPIVLYLIAPLPLLILLLKIIHVLRGNRNVFPIGATILSLYLADLFHLHSSVNANVDLVDSAYTLASTSIFFILFLFSGRLIPFFTKSKLNIQIEGLHLKRDIFLAALCVLSFIFKAANFELAELVVVPLCATLMIRRGFLLINKEVMKVPMLLILHVAHSWLIIYFLLRTFSLSLPDLEYGRSAFHALMAGALSTFAIGIMSRASLGHTGREVKADFLIKASFISLTFGALLRVFYPIFVGDTMVIWLHISMGFWTLGFILFLIKFTPIYLRPRL